MDKILKEHFDRYMKLNQLPPELIKYNLEAKLFTDENLLKIWRNNKQGIQYTDKNGNILRGAIDNLLVKGKKLIVLDYKTRGFPLKEDTHEHYRDQMDIYNFLLRKNGYQTEDYTYLLFYHPHKVEESGHVCFNTDLIKIEVNIKNAERIFKKALEVLEGEMPKADEKCGFCRWAESWK
jgi:RecB family exonuclease